MAGRSGTPVISMEGGVSAFWELGSFWKPSATALQDHESTNGILAGSRTPTRRIKCVM